MNGEEIKRRIQVFMETDYHGIPGKYIIAGLIVILILGVMYAFTGSPGTEKLELSVMTNGKYLEGANIQVLANGKQIAELTSGTGSLELNVPAKEITIKATRDGCKPVERTITPAPGMVLTLNMECNLPSVLGKECITFAKNIESAKIYVDGKPGRDCKVAVFDKNGKIIDLGWEVRAGYKVLLSYDSNNCPTKNYSVKIDCDRASSTIPMYSFLSDAKTYGKISLIANKEETQPQEQLADKTYDITVGVKDDKGTELSGITVKAVNSEGYELNLGYTNVITSASTDYTGVATLTLPAGQTFYLKAIDPAGGHPPSKIYGPFVATQPLTESIVMKSGFESKITVKDNETGAPIPWATVMVYEGTKLAQSGGTDETGVITLNLNKTSYTVIVTKRGYLPSKFTLSGGQDKTVSLQKLNDKNSAEVKLQVVNAHGYNDPMKDITVYIRDLEGHSITSGTSDSEGVIDLGRLPAGTYVAYVPANDNKLSNDVSQTFTVVAGKPTTVKISVVPPQVTLTVDTLVKGYPTPGVHVQVYNVKYNPIYPTLISEADSEPPGRVSFTLDKGSVVYLKASFTDPNGKVFGPIVTQKITVDSDKEVKLDLSETTLTQKIELSYKNITVNNTTYYLANSGEDGYIILPVNLPYYDPQKKETFDSVDVEVFTGELGTLNNPNETPIVIKDINALDLLRGNQDVYGLKVLKSTAVLNWNGVVNKTSDTALHTSKYVDIKILNYTHKMVYTIKIPIRARILANDTATHIYYRTVWRKGSAVYTSSPRGGWQNITVEVNGVGTAKWIPSNNKQFYAYQAWLSADETGKIPISKISDGSEFYLQVNLVVRRDLPTWSFMWAIRPNLSIQPEEYSGYIYKADGSTIKIYTTNVSGDTITGSNVSAEDEIHLAIKFHADVGMPKAYIAKTIKGEFDLMGDRAHPLGFQVIPAPKWEQTNIPNVLYKEDIKSYFADNKMWVTQSDDFISTYSYELNEPRPFMMVYTFKNTGSENKKVTIAVRDDGSFDNKPMALFCPIEVVNQTESKKKIAPTPPHHIIRVWRARIPIVPIHPLPIETNPLSCQKPVAIVNKTFTVAAGGSTTVVVKGVGTPDLAYNSSKIDVYFGLANDNEIKLWKTYPHGMLDYNYLISDADRNTKPTLETTRLKISVLRLWYENGEWHNSTVLPSDIKADNKVAHIKLSGDGLGGITVYATANPTEKFFIADVAGKLRPGNIRLESSSEEYGKLVREIRIGGLNFDPSGVNPINWNLTKAYNKNEKLVEHILITNLENKPVNINFTWYPNVPSAYGIGYYYTVFKPSGEEVGNTQTIPPRGEMKVTIYTYGAKSCSSHRYYFHINGTESGTPAGANYYIFNLICNGSNSTTPETNKVIAVRDGTPPQNIGTSSCGVNGNVYSVCDADQFVAFLVKAANELSSGEKKKYVVNLGYETLSVDDLNNIAERLGYSSIKIVSSGHQTAAKDIIIPSNVESFKCGEYILTMNLTKQGDIQILSVAHSNEPWCNPDSSQFIVGLMNPDKASRNNGRGTILEGDSIKEFINATLTAMKTMPIKPEDLYGYAGTDADAINSVFTSGTGNTYVSYTETNEAPVNINCNDLGDGFKYCYTVATTPTTKIMIYFVYPATISISSKEGKVKLNEYRIKMAKALLNKWFGSNQGENNNGGGQNGNNGGYGNGNDNSSGGSTTCKSITVDFTAKTLSCSNTNCVVRLNSTSSPTECIGKYDWYLLTSQSTGGGSIPPELINTLSGAIGILSNIPYMDTPIWVDPTKPPVVIPKWYHLGSGSSITASVPKLNSNEAMIELQIITKGRVKRYKIKKIELKVESIICKRDADNDGYYNVKTFNDDVCPPGWSKVQNKINKVDCDDSNASIHPGATESYDGKDDNCDGSCAAGECGGSCGTCPSGYTCSDYKCVNQQGGVTYDILKYIPNKISRPQITFKLDASNVECPWTNCKYTWKIVSDVKDKRVIKDKITPEIDDLYISGNKVSKVYVTLNISTQDKNKIINFTIDIPRKIFVYNFTCQNNEIKLNTTGELGDGYTYYWTVYCPKCLGSRGPSTETTDRSTTIWDISQTPLDDMGKHINITLDAKSKDGSKEYHNTTELKVPGVCIPRSVKLTVLSDSNSTHWHINVSVKRYIPVNWYECSIGNQEIRLYKEGDNNPFEYLGFSFDSKSKECKKDEARQGYCLDSGSTKVWVPKEINIEGKKVITKIVEYYEKYVIGNETCYDQAWGLGRYVKIENKIRVKADNLK